MIPSLIFFNISLSTRFGLPLFLASFFPSINHCSLEWIFCINFWKTINSYFSPMDYSITSNLLLYFWWNIIEMFSEFSNLFLDFLLNILDIRFTCDVRRRLSKKTNFLATWWCFFISAICFGKVRLQISFETIMSPRRSLQQLKLQSIEKLQTFKIDLNDVFF